MFELFVLLPRPAGYVPQVNLFSQSDIMPHQEDRYVRTCCHC
jgi:hypothetical protein